MTEEELRALYVKSNNNGFLDFEKFSKLVNNSFNVDFPTADEVCEAIQKELDYGTVEYFGGNREFMFFNHGEKQNITDCYGDRYKITGFYKSSTLSLIGRFYEGLEKK